MSPFTRREFLKTSLAAGAAAGAAATIGTLPLIAEKRTATDAVPLGNSGLKVTRLAFGTGTFSGAVQAGLGQKEFSRQVAYAYDHGIRFFETAESYSTPAMLAEALKPFPRDSYHLMSKVTTDDDPKPFDRLEQIRNTSQTEYFDIMLLHWQHTSNWVSNTARWRDAIDEAQSKQLVRTRGASVHGLPALRQVPGDRWLQIAMIRMNHNGTEMDGPNWSSSRNPASVSEVVEHVRQVRKEGMGVISMKLVGAGAFTGRADRQAAMRFAFQNAGVDCVTVGFKNTQEIDEAIDNLNLALA